MQLFRKFIGETTAWLFWFFLRIIVHVLPLNTIYSLAQFVGTLFFVAAKSRRRIMGEELSRIAFGNNKLEGAEIQKIIRRCFDNFCKRQVEVLLYPRLTRENIDRIVSISGLENLDNALSFGRGAIILVTHFGSNCLIMPALGFRGYKINQVADLRDPISEIRNANGDEPGIIRKRTIKLIQRLEQSLPANFINATTFIRPAFECLKRNEILILSADGRVGANMLPIEFLGRMALFPKGPIGLAMRTKAPILPSFAVRQKNNVNKLIIEEPLEFGFGTGKESDLRLNTKKFLQVFERYVRKYPCHYAMYLWRAKARVVDNPLFIEETEIEKT